MTQAPTPPSESSKRKEAIEDALRCGGVPSYEPIRGGETAAVTIAAENLDLPYSTMKSWLRRVKGSEFEPDWTLWRGREIPELSPVAQRREIRDAAFWKRKADEFSKQLSEAEHIAEELGGLRNQSFNIPHWLMNRSGGKKGRSVVGLCLSDVHCGEVVSADELLGLNEYNLVICRRRLMRLFSAACDIPLRWTEDTNNLGFLLILGGDLLSGDIHEELRITNELTAIEQHRFMVEELTGAIRLLRQVYKRVHVVSVPGNHGRNYPGRPMAKLASRLSYDTLTAQSIADQFKKDARVSFQITPARDAVVPILGHSVFVTHGDAMGTAGGMGFIGPAAPIVRGTKKVAAQQADIRRHPDLIIHGHYHSSMNPGEGVLSNGSVVGYTEYPNGLRASVETPMQWLFLIHERWVMRERLPIKLEDPAPKPMPQVFVPPSMSLV